MKRLLLVGLGNPGEKYQNTRHNAGWLVLDYLLERWNDPSIPLVWKHEKKIQAEVTSLQHGGHEIYAIKPQTFMNRSGEAVRSALQWYANWQPDSGVPAEGWPNLVILHDDLDLETGSYKLQFGKGPKVHNGLNSVRSGIDTDQFWVARLGVDSRQGNRRIPGEAYVLQNLNSEEKASLKQAAQTLEQELFYVLMD